MNLILSLTYLCGLVAANTAIGIFGPWVSPIGAFLFIGLDLTLRDVLHMRVGWASSFVLTLAASLVSYCVNPSSSAIAVASSVSFLVAGVVDLVVFKSLFHRGALPAVAGSNLSSSIIDSLVFPLLAFGVFMPGVTFMQMLAKVVGGMLWFFMLCKYVGFGK